MKYAAACIHIKNEADIIGEWMAFHRAVGFEHLIIIDNGSDDASADIIRKFPDQSSVSYIFAPVGTPVDFEIAQIKTFGRDFYWMAFIDADEFLYPSNGGDIRNTLTQYEANSGIGVFWHIYGSSGHVERQQGLTIETMTRRAPDDYILNRHVKSIVKPSRVWGPLGSHIFKLDGMFTNENFETLHDRPPHGFYEELLPSHSSVRINHYHVRSLEQYRKKSLRGYFGIEDDKISKNEERFQEMWRAHDRNDVFDDSATAYLPLMRFYLD